MKRLLALAFVGCSSAPVAAPPGNTKPIPPKLVIAAEQDLGWLGLAAKPGVDWIPRTDATLLLPFEPTNLDAATMYRAIDRLGHSFLVGKPKRTQVRFGCDDNTLDVTTLDGEGFFAPGVVWILPKDSTWTPQHLPITGRPTPSKHVETAGPITVETVRTGDSTATMTFAWKGKLVFERSIVRGDMAGAPKDPIDLAAGGPGVPRLAAAWQVGGERGAVLTAFHETTYEGERVYGIVLDDERGREVDALALYMYRCAF